MKKLIVLSVVCVALLALSAPVGAAKKGFKTGIYTASGDVSFKFKVYKGTCYNRKGKKTAGYCLSGRAGTNPKLQMKCPVVQNGVKDFEEFAFLPNQALVPKDGKLKFSFTNPIRTDEWDKHTFNLTLKKNGRASGSLSLTAQRKSISVISVCESGSKSFTAKR